jgi:LemA protein
MPYSWQNSIFGISYINNENQTKFVYSKKPKSGNMKASRMTLLVILGVVAILFFKGCADYNKLVTLREQVSRDWSNVENVYQRRADLIPNLVNTVKGYAAHEQETFTQVTEARANATRVTIDAGNMNTEDMKRFQAAQGEISSALSRLLAVAENYPDLKANQNFLELQAQLEGTENRIAVERRNFNSTATIYNTKAQRFPIVILAKMFGFTPRPYFEAAEGTEKAPEVKF